jgi:hypothetical protein
VKQADAVVDGTALDGDGLHAHAGTAGRTSSTGPIASVESEAIGTTPTS